MKKKIAILGSTGSIGCQALEVILANNDKFQAEVLTAQNNVKLLIEQALIHNPDAVVISNEKHYPALNEALEHTNIKVYAGMEAVEQIVGASDIDMVLTALVGFAGLKPTINALNAGKKVALANKETLVVAGHLIQKICTDKNIAIIPVDSEHSAIFQCLAGESFDELKKIILTASGGPFLNRNAEYLRHVTKEEALQHPNWKMGPKVTIDSATMMNKGLEVIEAKWLFGLHPSQIEVIIHPQSIVHSLVEFVDGSLKAQLGLPDMRLPIQYALAYPQRIVSGFPKFSFFDFPELNFWEPDLKKFRNLALAYEALNLQGNMPCILNAANEIAVSMFLNNRLGFADMPHLIELCMANTDFVKDPSLEELIKTDNEARIKAFEFVKNKF